MRKICVPIIAGLVAFSAFGVGENVPTSKSYIDSVLVDKQDTIERTSGNNQALTNTGTAGEYGTKGIYDSTGSYATQQDALVDAATMNAAVQNAINAEFVCISWVDDDPTKDCLLMEIRGATERRSPNLFDASRITNTSRITNNGDGSFTVTTPTNDSAAGTGKTLSEVVPELEIGKTYIFSLKSSPCRAQMLLYYYSDSEPSADILWDKRTKTITQADLDARLYFSQGVNKTCKIYDIQIEEGTIATPYQPYGNIYLPSEQ